MYTSLIFSPQEDGRYVLAVTSHDASLVNPIMTMHVVYDGINYNVLCNDDSNCFNGYDTHYKRPLADAYLYAGLNYTIIIGSNINFRKGTGTLYIAKSPCALNCLGLGSVCSLCNFLKQDYTHVCDYPQVSFTGIQFYTSPFYTCREGNSCLCQGGGSTGSPKIVTSCTASISTSL